MTSFLRQIAKVKEQMTLLIPSAEGLTELNDGSVISMLPHASSRESVNYRNDLTFFIQFMGSKFYNFIHLKANYATSV